VWGHPLGRAHPRAGGARTTPGRRRDLPPVHGQAAIRQARRCIGRTRSLGNPDGPAGGALPSHLDIAGSARSIDHRAADPLGPRYCDIRPAHPLTPDHRPANPVVPARPVGLQPSHRRPEPPAAPALVVWPDHRPEQGRALPLAAARVRLGNRPSLDIQAARATLRDARLNAGRRIGGTARQFGPGEVTMDGYPAIEDHGLIGDLQTAALVSTEGIVDWYCAPRFDSPSIFASLLDRQRGGYFQIAPDG